MSRSVELGSEQAVDGAVVKGAVSYQECARRTPSNLKCKRCRSLTDAWLSAMVWASTRWRSSLVKPNVKIARAASVVSPRPQWSRRRS